MHSLPAREDFPTPAINLIPPTPPNIFDNDHFLMNTFEERKKYESCRNSNSCGSVEDVCEIKLESAEKDDRKSESESSAVFAAEADVDQTDEIGEEEEAVLIENCDDEKTTMRPPWRICDLCWRNLRCCDTLEAGRHLFSNSCTMDVFTQQRQVITRSCSLLDTSATSATFSRLTKIPDQCPKEKRFSRQRRITVASFMPYSTDQNGNYPEKSLTSDAQKFLGELNTEELCQWFTNLGLEKCLPFIKEEKLCGADIAAVDTNILELLHVTTVGEKEQLLSAIYDELHPPKPFTKTLDSLIALKNVDAFTGTTSSMSKSKSSPHVSCLRMSQRSFRHRNTCENQIWKRNTSMIEITINASQRIVHLRTPKETTIGKVMDSCIKQLGMTDDRSQYILKEKPGLMEELSPDRQIGSILTPENRQLELHLCKMNKQKNSPALNNLEDKSSHVYCSKDKHTQGNQQDKEGRIRELNQQVESLQNAILQIQELHHSLVAFCSELKNLEADVNVDRLGSVQLKTRLEEVIGRLNDKKQSLRFLRDNMDNSSAHNKKQLEIHLLKKMKFNCQVFKEEISIVHLNRQAAHLQTALQEQCSKEKAQKKPPAFGSFSQLVSPQSPAMLMVVQENQNQHGQFGFTCHFSENNGLVVDKVDNSLLCINDRLVEVNGVSVVNSSSEELSEVLLQGSSAQIVVLRQPPPFLATGELVKSDPAQEHYLDEEMVTVETPPQRKVVTI